ncbi:MAG: sodium:proton antiporter, partial [Muribaculaceae bacterium]|nr:sodium:proton antiporter [Muribaculaceae bacterium]
MKHLFPKAGTRRPSVFVASMPIMVLLGGLITIIITKGAEAISDFSVFALLSASGIALLLALFCGSLSRRSIVTGYLRSARQILPAVPILVSIALVSTTWMLSGVVPTLIDYGLSVIHPSFFLVITCAVCGIVSVLTGSSWSTIATIGIAFMGIGDVLEYNTAITAGAIISGAYFGDKMSPLSDTTVVASSTCGVDLFAHIRYMMFTTGPAMGISLVIFFIIGIFSGSGNASGASSDLILFLNRTFDISPWTLSVPVLTGILIARRVPTLATMLLSSLMGLIAIFVFQPDIVSEITRGCDGLTDRIFAVGKVLWTENEMSTGHEHIDSLVSTSGIVGMLPTVCLVLSAMVFGAAMIGTGMLGVLASAFTRTLRRRTSIVGATVCSGIMLNVCTADQYLSLIINGNMYRNVFRRFSLEPRLLSRTCEDSVSVTSVLIPWNSCG